MSLTSLSFLGIYFPALLVAYYNPFLRNNTFRKVLLLCASLGLYAFSEPTYVLLLLGIIIINYCLVKLSDKTRLKSFRITAIVFDILVLLSFKYINAILSVSNTSFANIAFPIGLSYYSFKSISYVIDSHDEKRGNLLDVAIYVSNFLTIVSGPLSRYKDELPTILGKNLIQGKFYQGTERLIIGLGKKIIIADCLGILATQCFAATELSVVMAWSGAIAYTLQLYFDFSGYTDMAIGIGYLFGFNLPENFDYPYMASSVSDFWKRWHISLTKWFTNYIYIPLGGSYVNSSIRHIFNLFVVWFVTGIWHGSALTFIIWSMIYCVLQIIEKYTNWGDWLKKFRICHAYTLIIVVIEWVIFRSSSVTNAFTYIKSMFFCNCNALMKPLEFSAIKNYAIPFMAGIILSTNLGSKLTKRMKKGMISNCLYNLWLILLFVISIIICIGQEYSVPLYAWF